MADIWGPHGGEAAQGQLLRDLDEVLQGAADLRALVASVYDFLAARLSVDRVTILLYDPELGCLVTDQFFGLSSRGDLAPPSGPQKLSNSISGRCFLRGTPVLVSDCSCTDIIPQEYVELLRLRSVIAVPLSHNGRPLGVLRLDDTQRVGRFSEADFPLLSEIADRLGPAIARYYSRDEHVYLAAFRQAYEALEERYDERYAAQLQLIKDLRASEEHFRNVAEHARDAIVSADARGRIVYMNPAARRMLGWPARTESFPPLGSLVPVRFQEGRRRGIKRYLPLLNPRQEGGRKDLALQRADGSSFAAECSVSTWKAAERWHFTAIFRDVTERRRGETVARVFTSLGHSLSRMSAPRDIALSALEAAEALFGWDSSYVDLVSHGGDERRNLVSFDQLGGHRVEVEGASGGRLGPLGRRTLQDGPQLLLRAPDYQPEVQFLYGDLSRPSLSIMSAPIVESDRKVGIISIQSYRPQAYRERDLELFAALANFCSGALERASAEERLRHSEEALRQESEFVRLLGVAAAAANETTTLSDAIRACLAELCTASGYPLAHALQVRSTPTGTEMVSLGIWHGAATCEGRVYLPQLQKSAVSARASFPGTALGGLPVWSENVSSLDSPRALWAKLAGVGGGLAIPIVLGFQVIAVLEFYSDRPVRPSPRLLEVLKHVGMVLGRVAEGDCPEHSVPQPR